MRTDLQRDPVPSSGPDLASSRVFERAGFTLHARVLDPGRLAALKRAFHRVLRDRPGLRSGAGLPEVQEGARAPRVRELVTAAIGPEAKLLRATLFAKSPRTNGPVAWHQDRVLPVPEGRLPPGFRNVRSEPDGPYAEAPREILEQLLTLRIELDGSSESNGALVVAPGTHLAGLHESGELLHAAPETAAVLAEVPAGGALRIRPLLLRRCPCASGRRHGRFLQLEFAPGELVGSTLRRV